MTKEQLAVEYAGLRPDFDRSEESYFRSQNVKIYDSFVAGWEECERQKNEEIERLMDLNKHLEKCLMAILITNR